MKQRLLLTILSLFLFNDAIFADIYEDSQGLVYDYQDYPYDGTGHNKRSGGTATLVSGASASGEIEIPEFINPYGTYPRQLDYFVTSIGSNAFSGCTELTSVTIGSSVETIGEGAFSNCKSLTSITIPSSVKKIEKNAFKGCVGLNSVVFEGSETLIEDKVFEDCTGLTSVTFNGGISSMYSNSFKNCTSLTKVNISDLAAWCSGSYGDYFPYGYSLYLNGEKITDLIVPNSVNNIGSNAFWGCTSLTSVTISSVVESIGEKAFYGCPELSSIIVSEDNPVYDSRDNCNCIVETATNTIVVGNNKLIIPKSITAIGNYAFAGHKLPKTIVIPNSVTSIGDYAFSDCIGLTSVKIGKYVTGIGDYAFNNCEDILNITFLTSRPFGISSNVFSCQNWATLHVLERYVPVFRGTAGWKDFFFVEGVNEKLARIDINDDGDVNTADVNAIYNVIMNGEASGFSIEAADINNDGDVNTGDVVAIYNYIINGL